MHGATLVHCLLSIQVPFLHPSHDSPTLQPPPPPPPHFPSEPPPTLYRPLLHPAHNPPSTPSTLQGPFVHPSHEYSPPPPPPPSSSVSMLQAVTAGRRSGQARPAGKQQQQPDSSFDLGYTEQVFSYLHSQDLFLCPTDLPVCTTCAFSSTHSKQCAATLHS